MKRFSFLLGAFALLFASAAQSDIRRGCNAEYRIQVYEADGVRVNRDEVAFGRFSARGKCRGKAWANDCRRVARSYALGCTQAHWIYRWDRKMPGQCQHLGADGPQDYKLRDLKAEIEWYACFGGAAPGFRNEVKLRLRSVSWGDKRCSGQEALNGSYRVTGDMCADVDSKSGLPPSRR